MNDMKGRISFKPGVIQHVYQRTNNGYLIFYTARDYLVFYSIIMTVARQHHVRILGLCLMVDHIHLLVDVSSKEQLSRFVQHYTSLFATIWNRQHGQSGAMFLRQYGFAPKATGKDIRSAIAYLYNNPVEKQLCHRPEQSQWNFLPYGASRHPFSEPLSIDRARATMRRAIREVLSTRAMDAPLSYTQLSRLARNLSRSEQLQLTDYIIRIYNSIDYATVADYFGGYSQLITAINTTKGSEYAIKEDFTSGSDRIYSKMTQFLLDSGAVECIDDLIHLPQEERLALLEPICIATGASVQKASKYLHLPCGIKGKSGAQHATNQSVNKSACTKKWHKHLI